MTTKKTAKKKSTRTKHSKAPWRSFAVDDVQVANGSVILSDDENSPRICVLDDGGEHTLEIRANQRLILSSPDILRVLQRLVSLKKHKKENGKSKYYLKHQPKAWADAIKVIATATGVES